MASLFVNGNKSDRHPASVAFLSSLEGLRRSAGHSERDRGNTYLCSFDGKLLQTELCDTCEDAEPVIKKISRMKRSAPRLAGPIRGLFEVEIGGKPFLVEYKPDTALRDTEQGRHVSLGVKQLRSGLAFVAFQVSGRSIRCMRFFSQAGFRQGKRPRGPASLGSKHFP